MYRINGELDYKTLDKFISQHNTELARFQKLQRYYDGKHDIITKPQETISDKNRIVTNYCKLATTTVTGFLIGKPIKYNCDDMKYLDTLNYIFDKNDEDDKNSELAKTLSVKGEAYEVLYIKNVNNKPEVRFAQVPVEEMFVVYNTDIEPELQYAVRHYKFDDQEKVEIYSKKSIRYLTKNDEKYVLDQEVPHFFDEVPVIHYINNSEKTGDFEGIISLQDDYNNKLSEISNNLSYFNDAYMVISNMSETQKTDIESARENRVFFVEKDGKIEWLLKPMDDAVVEHHKKTLKDNIFLTACFPDWSSEEFVGNLSGVAIRFKILNLEQLCSVKERKMTKGLMRRIRLITNFLNKQGNSFNTEAIKISFVRNLPENLVEIADVITKLRGIIADSTLIALLPFVEDVNAELEAIKEQNNGELSAGDVKGVLSKYINQPQ